MYRWITLAGVLLVTGSGVALLLVGNEPELEEVVVEVSTSGAPGLAAVIAETSTAQAGLGALTPEISTASAGLGALTPEIRTATAGLAAIIVEVFRPMGACCDGASGVCTDNVVFGDCVGALLAWFDSTLCSDITCEQLSGACCHPLTSACTEVDEGTCMGSGSDFQGNGTTCSPNPCPALPTSAQCQLAKLTAGDADCGDFFGAKVSISGDRVLIAGDGHDHFGNNAGVAYIFRRDGTTWIEEAELSASDAMAGDQFGIRVSISGDRALIGAWAHDHFGTNAGAAYIFKRNGSTWIQEAELKGNDTTAGDAFGLGVCLSDDFAVVGAPGDNCAAGGDCGSAYVFRRQGTSWVQEDKLVASNAAANDKFGGDCSISGNRVVVGAIQGNPPAFIPFPGKAYVFRRVGMTWAEEAELAGTDAGANDLFGLRVSIDGDYIFVGASFHDAVCPQDPDCNSGAVYVFRRTGNTWVETQKLTALDTGQADNFGKDVALGGDLAVVGVDGDDDFAFNTGAAYIFRREGDLWIESTKLTASDPDESDRLGFSVSLSGGLVVAGAFQDDDAFPTDSGCNSGSAYVFAIGGDCNNKSNPDACDIADGTSNDANGNGIPDECDDEFPTIPTVSEWGLVIMTLLLLTGAKIYFGRRGVTRATT